MLNPFYDWLQDYFDPASFECILRFPDRFQYTLREFYKIYLRVIHK